MTSTDDPTTYRLTYFDDAMSERTRMRCEYQTRRYTDDIMAIVFSETTAMSELREIMHQIGAVLIYELSAVRGMECTPQTQIAETMNAIAYLEAESAAVQELSEREAMLLAEQMSYPCETPLAFFIDFDDSGETLHEMLKRLNPRQIKPPSGRELPLLSTLAEELGVPERPPSMQYERPNEEGANRGCLIVVRQANPKNEEAAKPADNKRLKHSKTLNRMVLKSAERERAEYRLELRKRLGAMRNLANALHQMILVNTQGSAPIRGDLQMAILYAIYASRSVRRVICMNQNDVRAPEWAPLHESKVGGFMRNLNVLTEKYHIGDIDASNYLASMRHTHAFGFAVMYTDAEFQQMQSQ